MERIEYYVARMDGDYAYLKQIADETIEEKCVARALLPAEIYEGCKLSYEMFCYEMME